jgi:hypothetical protein
MPPRADVLRNGHKNASGWFKPPTASLYHYMYYGKSLCATYKFTQGSLIVPIEDQWHSPGLDCAECTRVLRDQAPDHLALTGGGVPIVYAGGTTGGIPYVKFPSDFINGPWPYNEALNGMDIPDRGGDPRVTVVQADMAAAAERIFGGAKPTRYSDNEGPRVTTWPPK